LDLIAAIIFVIGIIVLRKWKPNPLWLWQVRDLQESSCIHLYKRGGAVMKYTIKAGVLYKNESQLALVRIKSALLGPQRKILSIAGELLLTADARYLDESKASSGDVRNREYLLTDNENQLVGSARPGYVDGDDPNVVGWPICRMPRVDHANIVVNGEEYLLTMHNSQNYSLINAHNSEVLRIMHKGIAGGWAVEDICGFVPEIICGIFIFCRYIEQENEFLIV
jgi:hypothetical protein